MGSITARPFSDLKLGLCLVSGSQSGPVATPAEKPQKCRKHDVSTTGTLLLLSLLLLLVSSHTLLLSLGVLLKQGRHDWTMVTSSWPPLTILAQYTYSKDILGVTGKLRAATWAHSHRQGQQPQQPLCGWLPGDVATTSTLLLSLLLLVLSSNSPLIWVPTYCLNRAGMIKPRLPAVYHPLLAMPPKPTALLEKVKPSEYFLDALQITFNSF